MFQEFLVFIITGKILCKKCLFEIKTYQVKCRLKIKSKNGHCFFFLLRCNSVCSHRQSRALKTGHSGSLGPFRQAIQAVQKSVNLQYNTLGCLDERTNESSTKRLMFKVLFFFHDFLQNSLQKSFQFIFLFFYKITKIQIKSVDC